MGKLVSQGPFTAEVTPLSTSSTQHMWELLPGNRTSILPQRAWGRWNTQCTGLYLVSFKAKERFVVRQWSLQIILLQRHNKFYPVVFSLRKAIKNSRVQIRQLSPLMQMNIHPMIGWRRDEHGTHKHTHTRLMDSVSHIRSKTMHSLFWITS